MVQCRLPVYACAPVHDHDRLMPVTSASPTVCVLGQHALDYPRNVVNQRLMQAAGYAIALCHSRGPWWQRSASIVRQYLRVARRAQVVFVTEGAHRHMLWIKLATLWTGHDIVFDPFLSLYNTEVEDRKQHAPYAPLAWLAKWRDYVSCHCADYLVFDTHEHKDYFYTRYHLDKPHQVLRIGVDEAVFHPRAPQHAQSTTTCEVLFYGTYIPLQGIDVILAAADRLRADTSIRFTLVGDGQERVRIVALAQALGLPNVTFVEPLPPEQLAERVSAADICLGIFDGQSKASHVVPNKVVQCAAMGKAIVTRRSPAVDRYFKDGDNARLIEPDDADALAQAIRELALEPQRRDQLGTKARAVFERAFSVAAQAEVMKSVLDAASKPR